MNSFDDKIVKIKTDIKERERLRDVLKTANNRKGEVVNKKTELYNQLKKEEMDVEKLEGISISNFIHTILGDKVEKISKEKKEAVAAKFKYDSITTEYKNLQREIEYIENKIKSMGDLDKQLEELILEKEKSLKENNAKEGTEISRILDSQARLLSRRKELTEVIDAGKELRNAVIGVRESLSSASNWGTWDMLGGGFIATMAKHSKLDEAKNQIEGVQWLLSKFHRELQDLGTSVDLNIDIGSFLTFADYFFDGLFADWTVQSRIHDARDKVDNVIYRVDRIMTSVESELLENKNEYERLEKERYRIIENA